MPSPGRRCHTFIVRVWSEPTAPGAVEEWRGTVVQVPSGKRVSFRAFPALPGILEALIRRIHAS